jgi:hypothetical protein
LADNLACLTAIELNCEVKTPITLAIMDKEVNEDCCLLN